MTDPGTRKKAAALISNLMLLQCCEERQVVTVVHIPQSDAMVSFSHTLIAYFSNVIL